VSPSVEWRRKIATEAMEPATLDNSQYATRDRLF